MPDMTAAEWLRQEALDHLDDDILGTYELVWLLNGSEYKLAPDQAALVARAVLEQVVAERGAVVVPMKWPARERLDDPVDWRGLSDAQMFEFTGDGEYYALMLPDDL